MPKSLLGAVLNRTPVDISRMGRGHFPGIGAAPEVGIERNLQSMEAISTIFSIVDGISTGMAKVEWSLYRSSTTGNDEDREEVTVHPALTVWNKPNPYFTQGEFVEAMQQHYELTGEYWWVLSRQASLAGRAMRSQFPLEMWVVRPDRIRPVPHPQYFIDGFMYRAGGEEVALTRDQVIFNKRQNPMDPYRGLSPIGSLLFDIEGEKAAAAYNLAFFRNGAMPGGLITSTEELSDPEFEQLMERWNVSHKGAGNAHRVGFLEKGEFTPINYTRKDMEFIELRKFSKETIRQAYRYPRPLLGDSDNSNRANHEASKLIFSEELLVPRLERLRDSLNDDFLPMFGSMGEGYEFDFVDPSPEDRESDRADQTANVDAATKLIDAGFDPSESLDAFHLPEITFIGKATPPPQFGPPSPEEPDVLEPVEGEPEQAAEDVDEAEDLEEDGNA